MSADNVINLPTGRILRFTPAPGMKLVSDPAGGLRQLPHARRRCRAQDLADITAALMQLCDDDKRIIAHLMADELGYDLVPARRDPPKAG